MKRLLFNPGPTNVHDSVRRALLTPDYSHRENEFAVVLKRVCAKLTLLTKGGQEYDTIPFVASGTGANEAMISVVHGKILSLIAGRYSERLFLIAKRLGVEACSLNFDPYQGIDTALVEEALSKDPSITHVTLVHHETTTGVMAPLTDLGKLAKKMNVQLLVDGVSSIGGHDFDLKRDNISMCTVNANKCIESLPGISFVIAKKEAIIGSQGKSRSFYFDIHEQWLRCSTSGKPPFTAAIQLFFAADSALDRLLIETVSGRASRYRNLKMQLTKGLSEIGFRSYPIPPEKQSNILTLAYLPKDIGYPELHEQMGMRGITIYTDKETLNKGIIFFATLGCIGPEDVDYFLITLSESVFELRKHKVGSLA